MAIARGYLPVLIIAHGLSVAVLMGVTPPKQVA